MIMKLASHKSASTRACKHANRSTCKAPVILREGIKLPKIDVLTFDENIMNWRSFWGQYDLAFHLRAHLTDAEKSAYLRHLLQHGLAKHIIEGLSGTGSEYSEPIECLQKLYQRPGVYIMHTYRQ